MLFRIDRWSASRSLRACACTRCAVCNAATSGLSSSIPQKFQAFSAPPPIFGAGVFASWKRCFAHIIDIPFLLMFLIHNAIVCALLLWRPTLRGAHRDWPFGLPNHFCVHVRERGVLSPILRRLFRLLRLHGNPLPIWHRRDSHCTSQNRRRSLRSPSRTSCASDPRCNIVTKLRQWASMKGLTIDARCTLFMAPFRNRNRGWKCLKCQCVQVLRRVPRVLRGRCSLLSGQEQTTDWDRKVLSS